MIRTITEDREGVKVWGVKGSLLLFNVLWIRFFPDSPLHTTPVWQSSFWTMSLGSDFVPLLLRNLKRIEVEGSDLVEMFKPICTRVLQYELRIGIYYNH